MPRPALVIFFIFLKLTIFRSLLLSSSAGGPYLSGFVPSISAIVESSKLDDVCLSSRHHTFTWEINIKSIKNMGENHRVTKHTCKCGITTSVAHRVYHERH